MKTLQDLNNILDNVQYKNWAFQTGALGAGYFLKLQANSLNGYTPNATGKKFYVSPNMDKSEIVQMALLAILVEEENKTLHHFSFQGQKINQTNLDTDALLEFAFTRKVDTIEPRMVSEHDFEL